MTCETEVVRAIRLAVPVDGDRFPPDSAWGKVRPAQFDRDWQGKNPDPERATEVRVLWLPDTLFLRFTARYRTITVFPDAQSNGRRNQLWDRDVAEAFLQPAGQSGRNYKEFEVSPNGFWIDLDIAPGGKRDLTSGLKRKVTMSETKRIWEAQLALPTNSLTGTFNPRKPWRVNFYRVEGPKEPRFYSAWRPTGTAVPDFHVPESFGTLEFQS